MGETFFLRADADLDIPRHPQRVREMDLTGQLSNLPDSLKELF
jgi:hypothetical protein